MKLARLATEESKMPKVLGTPSETFRELGQNQEYFLRNLTQSDTIPAFPETLV